MKQLEMVIEIFQKWFFKEYSLYFKGKELSKGAFVDVKIFGKVDKKHLEKVTKSICKHEDTSGYHDPQFFIFNTHLFYPGLSNSDVSIETSPQSLPACHYIDYIRLYQKDGEGELNLAE